MSGLYRIGYIAIGYEVHRRACRPMIGPEAELVKPRYAAGRNCVKKQKAERGADAAEPAKEGVLPMGKGSEDRVSNNRGLLVRKAMLNAAAELFAERGFAGTNLRDLADVLGISRPGLYYHFPNKEKILEALIEEVTLSMADELAAIAAQVDRDPEDALRVMVRSATSWVLENPVMFRVLDRSEADLPTDLRERHEQTKRTVLSNFTAIIERGIAVGKFRPVDPHIAALSVIGMRNWAAWWFKPEGRLPKHEVAETISEMAVRSLLRADAHRSRSERIEDVLRILKEDVAHIDHLLRS